MLHENFCDTTAGPIGRVVTSEEYPATAHEFFFWTAETGAALPAVTTRRYWRAWIG